MSISKYPEMGLTPMFIGWLIKEGKGSNTRPDLDEWIDRWPEASMSAPVPVLESLGGGKVERSS